MTPAVACNGRAVDPENRPVGPPCARPAPPPGPQRAGNYLDGLRAAGWRIGPPRPDGTIDAMCPSCAKPDPDLAKLLRQLTP